MTVEEFESKFPNHEVNPVTLRQWRKRGSVPLHAVTKAELGRDKGQSVTKPVTKSVTKSGAKLQPWICEEDHAFDILEDGYARGYPGDDLMMRVRFRTPGSIRRMAEISGKDVKKEIENWHSAQ